MSGETAGAEKGKKSVPHTEIAYGSITQQGGSLDLRITKGVKKSTGLGLKAGDDVLMFGVRGVGIVAVPAPKVVTGSNMSKVLDQIKSAIEALRESYDDEARKMAEAFLLDLPFHRRPTFKILNPKKRQKKKKASRD